MAQYESFKDLKLEALQRAGELDDGNSDYDSDAEQFINQLYRAIYAGANEFDVTLGEVWDWAKAKTPGLLKLIAPFETGSISLTLDSVSGTLSSAPAAGLGSMVGWFLKIEGRSTLYRIVSHTAGGTAITLDQAYLEDTGTALSFKLIKLDYELTGVSRLAEPLKTHKLTVDEDPFGEITFVDKAEFDRMFPMLSLQSGIPSKFTIVRQVEDTLTIRFNRYPSESTRIEYEYLPKPEILSLSTFTDSEVTAAADTLTLTGHQFVDSQPVMLSSTGNLPAGLSANVVYFITGKTASTVQLSLNEGGTAIDLTASAGSGTHTLSAVPRVPYQFRRALCYGPVHWIMVDKSDGRADYYATQTRATLQAMLVANRRTKKHLSKNRGRLIPRADDSRFYDQRGPRVFES